MKGAWAIAIREIGERRSVLVAALVAGVVPFASPLFPGVRSDQWAEARDLGALILAAAFGLGCALLLGATAIGRDLSERRLAFDFSRPLGSGGIWAGRLLGALGLSILLLGLVLLPATAVGGGLLSGISGQSIRGVVLAILAGMFFAVPFAHVASVAVRSRTGWLVVDLVCAVVVALIVGASGRFLFNAFALKILGVALIVVGALTVPALWTASAVQVAVGRTDLRRGHRAQSLTLWGILLVIALLFAAYVGRVLAATPADLEDAWGQGSPRGSWLAVAGTSRGRGDYVPLFLVDAATGRYLRLGAASQLAHTPGNGPILFSQDGRRAVVLRPQSPRDLRTQVQVVDLEDPQNAVRETSLILPHPWATYALSDAGGRLAVLDDGQLSVFDLDAGKTLAAARTVEPAGGTIHRLFFTSPERLRLVNLGERMTIDELDAGVKRIERTGEVEQTGELRRLLWDPDRDRYLIQRWGSGERALLLEGRSGARIRELACAFQDRCSWRFTADGRLLVTERGDGRARLRLLSVDGEEIRQMQVPHGGRVFVGGEITAGRMVVELGIANGDGRHRTLIADLDTGSWHELPEDLTSNAQRYGWWLSRTPEAGSLSAKLFRYGGTLVVFDPETGSRRTLAGR